MLAQYGLSFNVPRYYILILMRKTMLFPFIQYSIEQPEVKCIGKRYALQVFITNISLVHVD